MTLSSTLLPSQITPPHGPSNGSATNSNVHAIAPLLPDWHAGNVETGAIDRVVRRHVQRAPVVVAPGDVGGVTARDQQAAKQFAAGVDDVHAARPGAVDIALDVALHAVGDAGLAAGELVEDAAVAD